MTTKRLTPGGVESSPTANNTNLMNTTFPCGPPNHSHALQAGGVRDNFATTVTTQRLTHGEIESSPAANNTSTNMMNTTFLCGPPNHSQASQAGGVRDIFFDSWALCRRGSLYSLPCGGRFPSKSNNANSTIAALPCGLPDHSHALQAGGVRDVIRDTRSEAVGRPPGAGYQVQSYSNEEQEVSRECLHIHTLCASDSVADTAPANRRQKVGPLMAKVLDKLYRGKSDLDDLQSLRRESLTLRCTDVGYYSCVNCRSGFESQELLSLHQTVCLLDSDVFCYCGTTIPMPVHLAPFARGSLTNCANCHRAFSCADALCRHESRCLVGTMVPCRAGTSIAFNAPRENVAVASPGAFRAFRVVKDPLTFGPARTPPLGSRARRRRQKRHRLLLEQVARVAASNRQVLKQLAHEAASFVICASAVESQQHIKGRFGSWMVRRRSGSVSRPAPGSPTMTTQRLAPRGMGVQLTANVTNSTNTTFPCSPPDSSHVVQAGGVREDVKDELIKLELIETAGRLSCGENHGQIVCTEERGGDIEPLVCRRPPPVASLDCVVCAYCHWAESGCSCGVRPKKYFVVCAKCRWAKPGCSCEVRSSYHCMGCKVVLDTSAEIGVAWTQCCMCGARYCAQSCFKLYEHMQICPWNHRGGIRHSIMFGGEVAICGGIFWPVRSVRVSGTESISVHFADGSSCLVDEADYEYRAVRAFACPEFVQHRAVRAVASELEVGTPRLPAPNLGSPVMTMQRLVTPGGVVAVRHSGHSVHFVPHRNNLAGNFVPHDYFYREMVRETRRQARNDVSPPLGAVLRSLLYSYAHVARTSYARYPSRRLMDWKSGYSTRFIMARFALVRRKFPGQLAAVFARSRVGVRRNEDSAFVRRMFVILEPSSAQGFEARTNIFRRWLNAYRALATGLDSNLGLESWLRNFYAIHVPSKVVTAGWFSGFTTRAQRQRIIDILEQQYIFLPQQAALVVFPVSLRSGRFVRGHERLLAEHLCTDLALFASECLKPGVGYGVDKSGSRKHPLVWRIILSCTDLLKCVNFALGDVEGLALGDAEVLATERPVERSERARRVAIGLHAYGGDVETVDLLLGVLSTGLAHSVFIGDDLSKYVKDTLEFLCSLSDVACGTFCLVCGEHARGACEACRLVDYCSRRCQKADWKCGHKQVCAHLRDRVRVTSFDTVLLEKRGYVVATSFRRRVWDTVKYFDAANAPLSEPISVLLD